MRLAIFALTLFSSPSFAASSIDKLLGSIGAVSLEEDTVEVPLYSSPRGGTNPYIQVQVGEDQYLFGLLSAQKEVWVSERVAKEQGAKIKEQNKKLLNLCGDDPKSRAYKHGLVVKSTTLSEVKVGGMTLTDLSVLTAKREDENDAGQGGKQFYSRNDSGLQIDGYIGLESFPDDISWAILPSQGVVRFSKQAPVLEDGITLNTIRTESEIRRWGKSYPFSPCQSGPKLIRDPQLMVPEGLTVGGVGMPAIFEVGYGGSYYRWPIPIPADQVYTRGDIENRLLPVVANGITLSDAEYLSGMTALADADWFNHATIGGDVLAAYDMVADRSGSTLVLKKAETEKRHDPIPFMIAQALKTLEANKQKQAEAAEKAPIAKGAFGAAAAMAKEAAANAGADQAAAMLDKAKAIGADQAAAMLDKAKAVGADQAAAILDKAKEAVGLGTPEAEKSEDTEEQPASLVSNNVETGDAVDDGAVVATAEEPEILGKAPDWIRLKDLYLEANQLDKALEAAQNMVAIKERNCTYWGSLAVVQREMGDVANAIVSRERQSDLYHAWYDRPLEERTKLKKAFDKLSGEEKKTSEFYVAAPGCHRADGSLAAATFAAGDLLTIENLYRERMDLDSTLAIVAGNALITQGEYAHAQEPLRQALKMGGPQKSARRSLAVLYAEQGDWETASKLFERINSFPENTVSLWLWLDHLADAEGVDAAMAKAKALALQFPEDVDAQLALARSVSQGSNEPLKAKTRRATEGIFLKRMERYPRKGYLVALHAIWLNLWEPGSDEALAQAEKALSLGGGGTVYWALAQVHEAQGNVDDARQWRMRAAQRGATNIAYARMFTQ